MSLSLCVCEPDRPNAHAYARELSYLCVSVCACVRVCVFMCVRVGERVCGSVGRIE